MSLQFEVVPVTPFQQNCSIVWCDETNEAAMIDPGGDIHLLKEKLQQLGLTLTKLILTHGHLDHVVVPRHWRQSSMCRLWVHTKMMRFG